MFIYSTFRGSSFLMQILYERLIIKIDFFILYSYRICGLKVIQAIIIYSHSFKFVCLCLQKYYRKTKPRSTPHMKFPERRQWSAYWEGEKHAHWRNVKRGVWSLYPVELLAVIFPLSFSSFNLCEGGQEVISLHITNMTS